MDKEKRTSLIITICVFTIIVGLTLLNIICNEYMEQIIKDKQETVN